MKPTVSVGLPVYNGADHVERAIRAVLGQTLSDIELVVSDNASTDATEDICRRLSVDDARIRYFRNESNLGAASNFNKVFLESRAPFFKWLGHDDFLEPEALGKALLVLQENPEISIVHWLERMTDEAGRTLREYRPGQAFHINGATAGARFRQMLFWRKLGFGGDPFFGLMRRESLAATRLQGRGMNPNYLLLQELSLMGQIVTIPEVLATRIYNDERVTARRMIKWLDPQGEIRFPHFARAKEYFRVGLTHGKMGVADRGLNLMALLAFHLHPRELKGFLWDLTKGQTAQ